MPTLNDDDIQTFATGAASTSSTQTPTTPTRATPTADDTDSSDTDSTPTPTPTRTRPTLTQTTRTPRRHAAAALARCLDPVDAETFFAEHWERRPLIVPRDEPGRFDDLLSEADVERLVCSTAIRYPAFRLVQEGRQIGLGDYASDVSWRPPFTSTADVPRVARPVGGRRDDRAAGAARQLASAGGLLPGARGGARPRRPGELVLHAARLAGLRGAPRHARRAHPPGRGREALAASTSRCSSCRSSTSATRRTSASTASRRDDLVLRAGDSLYLPRGWLHQAETSSSDSLHLTIGIAAHTWVDAARGALDACEDELAFRHGVEHGDGDGLTDLIAEQLDPELVERRRRRKFVDSRRPIREDGLSQLRALAAPRRANAARAARDGDRRPRRTARRAQRSSSRASRSASPRTPRPRCARASRATSRSGVADLPGELDDEGRLVLVRRLVREGFLRITG